MARPLSSVDAAWLRIEDPTNLMVVTGILVFEEPLDQRRVRSLLHRRLLSFDRFRQRVVEARFGIGPPRWVDDDRFDLDAHLLRVALPAPGGRAELEELVGNLMSTPLDLSRPLWQIHLVDGYLGGSVLLARLHHCIADGIALIQLLLSLTDSGAPAEPAPPAAGADAWLPASPLRLVELARAGFSVVSTLSRLALLPPDPRTLLKGKLGVSKRAAWSEALPLDAVKAAGARQGVTVNDLLVAAVTGALRDYLEERGEPVDRLQVRAAVPVNLRAVDRGLELGNSFGLVILPLPIAVADRAGRLAELKHRMDRIKASSEAIVTFGLLAALGIAPRGVLPPAIRFFGSKASVVLTNVPGPREPLHLAGSRIAGCMFWVPMSGRLGLGISILSYAGGVRVGVAADSGLVPDPGRIVKAFERELKALLALAPAKKKPAPRRGAGFAKDCLAAQRTDEGAVR